MLPFTLPETLIDRLDVLDLQPLTEHRFAVEIEGLPPGSRFVAGFSAVRGLTARLQVREVNEGGFRGVHRFARRRQDSAVTIQRLMTADRFLWDWHAEASGWEPGKPDYTRSVSIYMIDAVSISGLEVPFEVWRWDLTAAWPSEWSGPPDLDALSDRTAHETVTLQHRGISEAKGIFSGTIGQVAGLLAQR